jgi:ribonuclease P protein component
MLSSSIKNNKEFKKAYRSNLNYVSRNFVVYAFKNNFDENRLGITVSKKVGNAVKRNRARRIIKEAYRFIENEIECCYDIVIVARSGCKNSKSTILIKELIYSMRKIKIYND